MQSSCRNGGRRYLRFPIIYIGAIAAFAAAAPMAGFVARLRHNGNRKQESNEFPSVYAVADGRRQNSFPCRHADRILPLRFGLSWRFPFFADNHAFDDFAFRNVAIRRRCDRTVLGRVIHLLPNLLA